MNILEMKRKRIFNFSIINISFFVLSIIFIIAGTLSNILVLNIFGIILLISSWIDNIINSTLILMFPNFIPEIENRKLAFGIIGIILLLPIITLIFSIMIKEEVKNYNNY